MKIVGFFSQNGISTFPAAFCNFLYNSTFLFIINVGPFIVQAVINTVPVPGSTCRCRPIGVNSFFVAVILF